jgi:hypothetical protein
LTRLSAVNIFVLAIVMLHSFETNFSIASNHLGPLQ